MATNIWFWIGFNAFVLLMLALDLGVFNRKAHMISIKEAGIWSVIWISLALIFNVGIYFLSGAEPATQFLTGYLIEKSLSIDNIFVFVLLFSFFQVPKEYQHRVLFWGVLGALVMRGILIAVGAVLIEEFHWILYAFGAFLIFSGFKMAFQKEQDSDPTKSPVVQLIHRVFPISDRYHGSKFLAKENGKTVLTLLALVLVVIEFTDLIFAVDSIPAVFAVTRDSFIVYTSNIFAIMGLRSLYFVLAGVIEKFHYLKAALSVILVFVGVKMLTEEFLHIGAGFSLLVIVGILVIAVIASLLRAQIQAKSEKQGYRLNQGR